MARYKSYFPVSHELLHDHEVDELCDKFGLGGLRLWLKILSLLDQKENAITMNKYLVRQLSIVAKQREPNTWLTLSWMLARGWLASSKEFQKDLETVISSPKYMEYHRSHSRICNEKVPNELDFSGIGSSLNLNLKESKNKNMVKNKKTSTIDLNGLQASFDKFYESFPKHVAKEEAKRAWKKIAPSPALFAEIMAGVERYKQTDVVRRGEMKYIKQPGSWLNGKRWEDEPSAFGKPKPRLVL